MFALSVLNTETMQRNMGCWVSEEPTSKDITRSNMLVVMKWRHSWHPFMTPDGRPLGSHRLTCPLERLKELPGLEWVDEWMGIIGETAAKGLQWRHEDRASLEDLAAGFKRARALVQSVIDAATPPMATPRAPPPPLQLHCGVSESATLTTSPLSRQASLTQQGGSRPPCPTDRQQQPCRRMAKRPQQDRREEIRAGGRGGQQQTAPGAPRPPGQQTGRRQADRRRPPQVSRPPTQKAAIPTHAELIKREEREWRGRWEGGMVKGARPRVDTGSALLTAAITKPRGERPTAQQLLKAARQAEREDDQQEQQTAAGATRAPLQQQPTTASTLPPSDEASQPPPKPSLAPPPAGCTFRPHLTRRASRIQREEPVHERLYALRAAQKESAVETPAAHVRPWVCAGTRRITAAQDRREPVWKRLYRRRLRGGEGEVTEQEQPQAPREERETGTAGRADRRGGGRAVLSFLPGVMTRRLSATM
ncbi:unnamed protein product [Vitrella brassicaformis CCMP3155]|uniref:Uncharacterized protein n=1 Tax=Vitrella brassicaformis (strain CCMP3155) TaxID=1169540 RepID=A0A0G4EY26_VITBC|nr:unnamed protein product [Vitrella brassicaformis CCMP3155]|eukprot:CEM03631.1 unnamed protein product [Vitrella brassicaformis CCMP3155]